MSKKVTLIVQSQINLHEAEALLYYSQNAMKILQAHNGRLLGKYTISKTITKRAVPTNVMLMEFEDDAIIEALSLGEEYQKLIPYRDKAFSMISISFT